MCCFDNGSLHRQRAESVAVTPKRRTHIAFSDVAGAYGFEMTINFNRVPWSDEVDVGRGDNVIHFPFSIRETIAFAARAAK